MSNSVPFASAANTRVVHSLTGIPGGNSIFSSVSMQFFFYIIRV
jgi:hypothetical protein